MCGIFGMLDPGAGATNEVLLSQLSSMSGILRHRGPDADGFWTDAQCGIALGHRRLSILDLSPSGAQPMASADGRYVLAFNGEIYNHADIRAKLESQAGRIPWRGRSDTETMLGAIQAWGLESAIGSFTGMFAFLLWDRLDRKLHLAVDRIGEKPLYYGWAGGRFLFGSELKAFRVLPGWEGGIDRDAIALLLRYNYIPAPHCIYLGFRKLLPGSILTLDASTRGLPEPRPYWSVAEAAARGKAAPFPGDDREATEALDRRLREVVRRQMVADVPLGAFLSGGVDSSTIVAMMQAQSSRPVRTFTIGFQARGFNEAEQAKAVARHLGTDHTEVELGWDQAISIIPRLATLYDEPFSDSSQIPTFLVSQLARHHVTVSLSGDGGDELFGGYNRHVWGEKVWRRSRRIPTWLRNRISLGLQGISQGTWDGAFRKLAPLLPSGLRIRSPGEKVHKLAHALSAGDPLDMYRLFASHWDDAGSVVIGAGEPPILPGARGAPGALGAFPELMMYMDMMTYLPGDILVKVDRASMGNSLEARVPFLDHGLIEFAWSLPVGMKVRGAEGKWILKQVLARYVPVAITDRPKMGFAIPVGDWLRGPLRDWAEASLDEERLKREGFFRPERIRRKWKEHLEGRGNWQHHLWDVLIFQNWKAGI